MKEMGGYEEFGVGSWADKTLEVVVYFQFHTKSQCCLFLSVYNL